MTRRFRRPGNPFVVGRASYQKFLDAMAGGAAVNLARRKV
jgi:hypothetical protein